MSLERGLGGAEEQQLQQRRKGHAHLAAQLERRAVHAGGVERLAERLELGVIAAQWAKVGEG